MIEIILSTVVVLALLVLLFILATSVKDERLDYIEKQKNDKNWDYFFYIN